MRHSTFCARYFSKPSAKTEQNTTQRPRCKYACRCNRQAECDRTVMLHFILKITVKQALVQAAANEDLSRYGAVK